MPPKHGGDTSIDASGESNLCHARRVVGFSGESSGPADKVDGETVIVLGCAEDLSLGICLRTASWQIESVELNI